MNYLVTYMRCFSNDPMIKIAYLEHTPEQKAMTEKLIKYLMDRARIIPVYWVLGASIIAAYVHPWRPHKELWAGRAKRPGWRSIN